MDIHIDTILPAHARHGLVVGQIPGPIRDACRRRLETIRTSSVLAEAGPAELSEPPADCLLMSVDDAYKPDPASMLPAVGELLGANGQAVLFFAGDGIALPEPHVLDDLFARNHLILYQYGQFYDLGKQARVAVAIAVKSTYNPVAHARELAAAGKPDQAVDILNRIPETLVQDSGMLARLSLEKQRHYLQWQESRLGREPSHALFSKARREFAQVTALSPFLSETYQLHARFWSLLGRQDMARRVLRSYEQARSENKLPRFHAAGVEGTASDVMEQPPLWPEKSEKPGVLVITHDQPDYGMDSLYHGLCTILGKQNVVEYPWKATLHGREKDKAAGYPCVHDYPGEPRSVASLEQDLKQGRFDLIIYADVVRMNRQEEIRRLLRANPDLPVVLYDTWDDCYTPLGRILAYTGLERFNLMFKREMLQGVDYAPNTLPLPFGYPRTSENDPAGYQRTRSVFWAGKDEYGLRPLYIPALEGFLGESLRERFEQDAYRQRLCRSRIGLSFFGCGFDTVRYWELPANGVMLLAERPPIHIPYNFVDGQSAVFFDDLDDMLAKLDYYRNHPMEAERIARNGYRHYAMHHTTTARARQFLGAVAHRVKLPGGRKKTVPGANMPDQESRPLFLGLVKGDGYGWGVCSRYLIKELSRRMPVHVLSESDGSADNPRLRGDLFQAVTNTDFDAMFNRARGRRNFAYTFFENELTAKAVENARNYDVVFGGSTWCRDRMREKGIDNCDVLIQGVDPDIFYPIEQAPPQDRFVIFSGGKFELRKGQDLVLKAVSILQAKYADVWLVNCWYNLWPASTRLMAYSSHIRFRHNENESWTRTMQRTYAENGLDPARIITHELLPQEQQRAVYAQTHIGVFPNRCEGGTNLVLMEYMACAKPVIVSNTSGHTDVVHPGNALLLETLKPYQVRDAAGALFARWEEPSLDELVARLEHAYHNRSTLRPIGQRAGEDMKQFTWSRSADTILKHLAKHQADGMVEPS